MCIRDSSYRYDHADVQHLPFSLANCPSATCYQLWCNRRCRYIISSYVLVAGTLAIILAGYVCITVLFSVVSQRVELSIKEYFIMVPFRCPFILLQFTLVLYSTRRIRSLISTSKFISFGVVFKFYMLLSSSSSGRIKQRMVCYGCLLYTSRCV